MSLQKITVIIRDNYDSNGISYRDPLIYTIEVADPKNRAEVLKAVEAERHDDLGDDQALDLDVLCAFAGDISPVADWRE